MRRTDVNDPITEKFMKGLKPISRLDIVNDEEWRFAPVGVLSHLERDTIYVRQLYAFAKAFNLPLFRWKLEMVDQIEDPVKLAALYDNEKTLWGYFVEGAPVMLNKTTKATRKLVLLHSLSFEGGIISDEVASAYACVGAKDGFQEITLETAPLSVSITVGGTEEHPRF